MLFFIPYFTLVLLSLILVVHQPVLSAFFLFIFIHLPIHCILLSFLCGSLPWCSFYGQQPQAPHLSWSGLMCFERGWVDEGVRAHEVPIEPHIRTICHTAAWWPRPFNLAGLWLCIFILRVAAIWKQYIFFILDNIPTLLSHDSHICPWQSQPPTRPASGMASYFSHLHKAVLFFSKHATLYLPEHF